MSQDPHFETYPQMKGAEQDEPTGEFGWRFQAANGDFTFIGGEGFTERAHARRAIEGAVFEVSTFVPGSKLRIRDDTLIDADGVPVELPIIDLDEGGDPI
jgi:hypothetical protein